MTWRIEQGDNRQLLAVLPPGSVQTCVTSPPYWALRDYDVSGQLGQEPTPEEYVANMVDVFRGVRRVLKDDGTLWLNLGDTYREKQLVGIPWRVAFALQADGWFLRSDIIWAKPNPIPDPAVDRPSKAHEYMFMLARSSNYFYDGEAVRESFADPEGARRRTELPIQATEGNYEKNSGRNDAHRKVNGGFVIDLERGRAKRTVWTVPSQPCGEAHFATFPPKLIEPCILAGSRIGDTVLDPFNGAATTGLVAKRFRRDYIGLELNPEYVDISKRRMMADSPLAEMLRLQKKARLSVKTSP